MQATQLSARSPFEDVGLLVARNRECRRPRDGARPMTFRSSFALIGPGCRIVQRGGYDEARFNFPQRLWLERGVAMGLAPHRSPALETLAVNLLDLSFKTHATRVAVGHCHPLALRLGPAFQDYLIDLPRGNWYLPLETIRSWIEDAEQIA